MESEAVLTASLAVEQRLSEASALVDGLTRAHDARELGFGIVEGDLDPVAKDLESLRSLLYRLARHLSEHGDDCYNKVEGKATDTHTMTSQVTQRWLDHLARALAGGKAAGALLEVIIDLVRPDTAAKNGEFRTRKGRDGLRQLHVSLEYYKLAIGIGLCVGFIFEAELDQRNWERLRDAEDILYTLQANSSLDALQSLQGLSLSGGGEGHFNFEMWLDRMSEYTAKADAKRLSNSLFSTQETFAYLDNVKDKDETQEKDSSNSTVQATDQRKSADIISKGLDGLHLDPFSDDARIHEPEAEERNLVPSLPLPYRPSVQHSRPLKSIPVMNQANMDIDWSPLVPSAISESEFHTFLQLVQQESESIETAARKRATYTPSEKRNLDGRLLQELLGTHPDIENVRQQLENGASTASYSFGVALQQVVQKGNMLLLCLLLRFGADPNAVSSEGTQPSLITLAVGKDPTILCALLLARGRLPELYCPEPCQRFRCGEPVDGVVRFYCSPLLTVIANTFKTDDQGDHIINPHSYRTARFLLANGYDPLIRTCKTPIEVVAKYLPEASQARMYQQILSYCDDREGGLGERLLNEAILEGRAVLVRILLERCIDVGALSRLNTLEEDPVSRAISKGYWQTIEAIARQPRVDVIHAFNLIRVFMDHQWPPITKKMFEQGMRILLGPGVKVDRKAKEDCIFTTQKLVRKKSSMVSYSQQPVCQSGSFTLREVVDKCPNTNKNDKKAVVSLLKSLGCC